MDDRLRQVGQVAQRLGDACAVGQGLARRQRRARDRAPMGARAGEALLQRRSRDILQHQEVALPLAEPIQYPRDARMVELAEQRGLAP